MLIVASAWSIQYRQRPADKQQAADQAHAQWKDPDLDFAVLINIWRSFEEQRLALGSSGCAAGVVRIFLIIYSCVNCAMRTASRLNCRDEVAL